MIKIDLILNDLKIEMYVIKGTLKKQISLFGKKTLKKPYYFPETNKINTYNLKTKIDLIGLNEKNVIFFYYKNVPCNKIIEIKNCKKNTNILVLSSSFNNKFKIGDILTFTYNNIILENLVG